jgi:dTDP-4-dehydrorhamnose 3,5-epimerase
MRPVDRLEFLPTPIAGLMTVRRSRIEDHRGFLSRLYDVDTFAAAGIQKPIAQINHTLTRRRAAVRGMHFQWPPHAEAKLVACLHGEIFDVAVDLRRKSPTFLQWHGEVLSEENQRSLLIPEGFAHGFQTLTGDCELVYLHTALYQQAAEGGLSPIDPRLSIAWPLEIAEMSDRDRGHPALTAGFDGIAL